MSSLISDYGVLKWKRRSTDSFIKEFVSLKEGILFKTPFVSLKMKLKITFISFTLILIKSYRRTKINEF